MIQNPELHCDSRLYLIGHCHGRPNADNQFAIVVVRPCLIDANLSARRTLQHIGCKPCRVYVKFTFPAAHVPSYSDSGPFKRMVYIDREINAHELTVGSAALISID